MYWMNMHDRPPQMANVMGCVHTDRSGVSMVARQPLRANVPFTLATARGSMAALPAMKRTTLSSESWKGRMRATGATMTVAAAICVGSVLVGEGEESKIYCSWKRSVGRS